MYAMELWNSNFHSLGYVVTTIDFFAVLVLFFFLVFEICIEEGGCQFRCFWWCEKKLIFLLLDKIAITLQFGIVS